MVRMAGMARAGAAMCAAWCCAAALAMPSLPEPVLREQPGLALHGRSELRFLGIKVYDIALWAPGGKYDPAQPCALILRYDMHFKGADIARRSSAEMRGQGFGPDEKLERWRTRMTEIFPDVRPGDTLIGIHIPGKEARFYSGERFLATVADAEFARAFFAIWLAEKTSEPQLRQRLLGTP